MDTYQLEAEGGAGRLTYEIVSGPSWASINAETQELTLSPGAAAVAGSYSIMMKVTDRGGRTDEYTITFELTSRVTLRNYTLTVPQGGSATLQLMAEYGTPPYRYQKNAGHELVTITFGGLLNVGLAADTRITGRLSVLIQVMDAAGETAEATVLITIEESSVTHTRGVPNGTTSLCEPGQTKH